MKVGQIVTIKEDDLPPTKWLMGRIIDVFPGKDSRVRVAKVRMGNGELSKDETEKLALAGFGVTPSAKMQTIGGILERPIHKLCLLPVDDEE